MARPTNIIQFTQTNGLPLFARPEHIGAWWEVHPAKADPHMAVMVGLEKFSIVITPAQLLKALQSAEVVANYVVKAPEAE